MLGYKEEQKKPQGPMNNEKRSGNKEPDKVPKGGVVRVLKTSEIEVEREGKIHQGRPVIRTSTLVRGTLPTRVKTPKGTQAAAISAGR